MKKKNQLLTEAEISRFKVLAGIINEGEEVSINPSSLENIEAFIDGLFNMSINNDV